MINTEIVLDLTCDQLLLKAYFCSTLVVDWSSCVKVTWNIQCLCGNLFIWHERDIWTSWYNCDDHYWNLKNFRWFLVTTQWISAAVWLYWQVHNPRPPQLDQLPVWTLLDFLLITTHLVRFIVKHFPFRHQSYILNFNQLNHWNVYSVQTPFVALVINFLEGFQ